ncbi:MAG TPA: bifunctional glutamate N-acetyltransferase/amino-acid acetyltransferase ArgJ [Bacillota bacterium]
MKTLSGGVTVARGYSASGLACGIKKNGAPDLALVFSELPARAAGVFTTNKVKAAPVIISQERVKGAVTRAVIINSGNANACVGEEGLSAARAISQSVAESLQIKPEEVLLASTGVIGVPLPTARIVDAIPALVSRLSTAGGTAAAQAIMTTDTYTKEWAIELQSGIRIGGMAKGSGMIQPNMATLLSVITTDALLDQEVLQELLKKAVNKTFNRLTVDGDTSTNDSVFLLANGASGKAGLTTKEEIQEFYEGLYEVCLQLAKMLVRDGEGATKFLTVRVYRASSEVEAEIAARAVANSNLVKTAFFGEDANWGRILTAVGYSGINFVPERVEISLGDLPVYSGRGLPFDEEEAARILGEKEIEVNINLNQGEAEATIWTCDLSYDYVKINGSYRT